MVTAVIVEKPDERIEKAHERPGATARVPPYVIRDLPLVMLAMAHAVVLFTWPSIDTIAIGLWWNANTISHNFIHRPFFRLRPANAAFSCYLTALLGFPQSLWRDRHLAHHTVVPLRLRIRWQLIIEVAIVLGVWAMLFSSSPRFFATVYVPGYFAGLMLCAAQGHYEHVGGVISHYGRLYNFLCFNDGFHAEHHANPGVHWSELPARILTHAHVSRWPPALRWLDDLSLEGLERLVLRSPRLQRIVLCSHRRAFEKIFAGRTVPRHIVIIGGGLFPRTALILRELLPEASLTILDGSPENLDVARAFLPADTNLIRRRYVPGKPLRDLGDYDLAVLPLAFDGDRDRIYRDPPASMTLIHDWIWRRRKACSRAGRVVSVLLLKRINLVLR